MSVKETTQSPEFASSKFHNEGFILSRKYRKCFYNKQQGSLSQLGFVLILNHETIKGSFVSIENSKCSNIVQLSLK